MTSFDVEEKKWYKRDNLRPLPQKTWGRALCQEDRWNASFHPSLLKYTGLLHAILLNHESNTMDTLIDCNEP